MSHCGGISLPAWTTNPRCARGNGSNNASSNDGKAPRDAQRGKSRPFCDHCNVHGHYKDKCSGIVSMPHDPSSPIIPSVRQPVMGTRWKSSFMYWTSSCYRKLAATSYLIEDFFFLATHPSLLSYLTPSLHYPHSIGPSRQVFLDLPPPFLHKDGILGQRRSPVGGRKILPNHRSK